MQKYKIKFQENLEYYEQGIIEGEAIVEANDKNEAKSKFIKTCKISAFEKDYYLNVRITNSKFPIIGKMQYWDLGESTFSSASRKARELLHSDLIVKTV